MALSTQNEWNQIWGRKIQVLIGLGRRVYNVFFYKAIAPSSSPTGSFLEIGCGTASFLTKIAPRFRSTVGLDISEIALAGASNFIDPQNPIALLQGDCFRLPFKNEAFDVIWSQGLHEHFDNFLDIMKEEFRVCKKGGVVIIGVPYRYSYQYLWYLISRLPYMRWFWPWTEQVFFTCKEFLAEGQKITDKAEASIMTPWIFGSLIMKLPKT